GAQQMSWSDPAKLVVAAPKFKLIGGTTTAPTKTETKPNPASAMTAYTGTGFAISLPSGWTSGKTQAGASFAAKHGAQTNLAVAQQPGRGSQSLAQWEQTLVALAKSKGATAVTSSLVKEPGGNAVYLAFHAANQTNVKAATLEEYYFDAGTKAYLVIFDMPSSAEPGLRADIAKIVASFRLTSN
ncbi:MAG TPA: hypothetical protein VGH92_10150, partial [Gaiellaceae bacterium]